MRGSQLFAPRGSDTISDSMPRKQIPWMELGTVDTHNNDAFCAHLQYRSEKGVQINVRGPDRRDRHRAQIDLERIRLASTAAKTREEGLEIMAAEARRIQISAQFQAEAEAQRQRESTCGVPIEFLSDDDDEEPWLMDYPPPFEEGAPTPVSQQAPLTQEEANEALRKFRPIRSSPAILEHILACRADPNQFNLPPAEGGISPLANVMTFASEHHVAKMRELLLEHGAEETEELRDRWRIRQKADLCEKIRLGEARMLDERDYDPCGAAMEREM